MNLFEAKNGETNSEEGFTIIEIVVAIFVFGLIVWGLLGLFSNIFSSSYKSGGLLVDSDSARRLAIQLTAELRNAQLGSTGAYVLDTAEDQQIIYYSPGADGDLGVERIRYFAADGKLHKGITEYNGVTYNTSTEQTIVVQKNLANGSNPIFYYYDGNYTGSSTEVSLSQPVNPSQVRFIKLNLQIFNTAGVDNTNTYTVTSGAAIRNVKTNLGE